MLVRLDHNCWVHVTTIWDPGSGSRRPGIPAMEWMNDMKKQLMDQISEKQGRLEEIMQGAWNSMQNYYSIQIQVPE